MSVDKTTIQKWWRRCRPAQRYAILCRDPRLCYWKDLSKDDLKKLLFYYASERRQKGLKVGVYRWKGHKRKAYSSENRTKVEQLM